MSSATDLIRYQQNAKSKGVAYLLWFFFGGLGLHRFYLRSYLVGFLMLGLWFLCVVFIFGGAPAQGGVLSLVIMVMVTADLFLIPGIVRRHNEQVLASIEDPIASFGVGA